MYMPVNINMRKRWREGGRGEEKKREKGRRAEGKDRMEERGEGRERRGDSGTRGLIRVHSCETITTPWV
jgi:hypothetical protein